MEVDLSFPQSLVEFFFNFLSFVTTLCPYLFQSLFLVHNDKVLKHKSAIQQKKFNNLLKDKKLQHDPKNVNFNHSSYVLSKAVRYLHFKGLDFSIPL